MYRVYDKWVEVSYIYKATNSASLPEDAEQWQIDLAMNDAEITITKEWILRDEVRGLKEAVPSAMETLERHDIALLCTYNEDPTHIIMKEEDKLDFLSKVGPSSIYNNVDGDRKKL